MRFLISFCVSVLLLAGSSIGTDSPFYPFGSGDTENDKVDDGSSVRIHLRRPFRFFGHPYNHVYVNNNGFLTFDDSWDSYSPFQFPGHGGKDLIAPFWTDIDNRGNGVISYQQYTSGSVLRRATHDINHYFPGLNFSASYVFVATWDKVAYYPYSGTETSFQVVLISNSHESFIFMNYGSIAPTQYFVQAGYDTSESSHHFSIAETVQYDITLLPNTTNINVTGRWAFRTDQAPSCCHYEGFSVQLGDSFWTDATCRERCTCSRRGLQCNQEPCTYSQACRRAAFQYSCQNIQRKTCKISGDPHYYTFDDRVFEFQGTRTYVVSQACRNDLTYYRIEVQNEHISSRTSWARMVRVFVYDQEIELVKGHNYEAKVNGTFRLTPFSLHNGSIHVYQSGFSLSISTDFGLVVTYNRNLWVTISVPYEYQNATCGLCGNFNMKPEDDFSSPTGEILSSEIDFANSWRVEDGLGPENFDDGCRNISCCGHDNIRIFSNATNCGILESVSGPFAACHSVLPPQTFKDNCVFDLCLEQQSENVLCQALHMYAEQCQHQGVQLGQWRQENFCGIICPEHSHFESEGTSCPATCSDPFAPTNCPLPNIESCICDDGYVLSGEACVPEENCGCSFEGFYFVEGETAFLDYGRHCVCSNRTMTCLSCTEDSHETDPNICHYAGRCRQPEETWIDEGCSHCACYAGTVHCEPLCSEHEVCHVVEGEYGCHLPQTSCSASGDPHYISFDGTTFDFQGTCRYVLAKVCDSEGLPHFQVDVRNEAWEGLSVSVTVEVFVNVSGHLIHMSKNLNGYSTVKVDGEIKNMPIMLDSVKVFASGQDIFVVTNFGLSVIYGGFWAVKVNVTEEYRGHTCGLCGNFNGHTEDDFMTLSGSIALSADQFGAEWKVDEGIPCSNGCGDNCPTCQDPTTAPALCQIIMDNEGPFSPCHAIVDPQPYFNACSFDACLSENHNDVLCRSVQSYVSACQSANAVVHPWREIASCAMICTNNSQYEVCGTDCGRSCSSIEPSCEQTCSEGCFCNAGFVRSGDLCVPAEQCGCSHNGFYYMIGEQFWDSECLQLCDCVGSGDLHCSESSCPSSTGCEVRNGHRGCYGDMSMCSVWGDPHYLSFDGAIAHFQGACSYEIVHTCGNVTDEDLEFRVVATNRHRGNMAVTFVSVVDVWLSKHGEQKHITIEQNRRVKVDGHYAESPDFVISDLVDVREEQGFVVLNALNKFTVHFDGHSVLIVRLSQSFHESVCGMCGNYNGDPADDKAMPSGDLAANDIVFGSSWTSETSTPSCGASHETSNPDECPFRQEYSQLCGIITNTTGPFQQCHLHIDPAPYFHSCVYDLCVLTPENGILYSAVHAYEAACVILGIPISDWSSGLHCSATDPCSGLNCTEDEWCGENNGVHGCFCNENHPRPESFDFSETCESSAGFLSLSRCQLFEAGFPVDGLHLSDPSCKGIVQNGRVEFHFDNNDHICGTTLIANGSHFIYENFVYGTSGSNEGLISREGILKLSFSCVYPQTQTLSMNMEINPLESIVHRHLPVGHGAYQVRMIPYQDAEFLHAFTGSVNVELNQQMFVEVRVDGVDSRQFATVIDKCWATPENNPDNSLRWDLITGECPNSYDHTVELLQNGVSTSSRFSFRMFTFTSNSSKVYLHCSVHLCLLASSNCTAHCYPGCHQREGRSLDFHDSASISMGPLVLAESNSDSETRASGASGLYGHLVILLVSLLSVWTLL